MYRAQLKLYRFSHPTDLAVSVDLPAVGNVLEATPEEPYL